MTEFNIDPVLKSARHSLEVRTWVYIRVVDDDCRNRRLWQQAHRHQQSMCFYKLQNKGDCKHCLPAVQYWCKLSNTLQFMP